MINTTRVNLSITHLLAASKFSRSVGELEKRHAHEPLGDFWDEINSDAIACVLTAVAGLEAYANEIFKDSETTFPHVDKAALEKFWEVFEGKPTLEKFEFALLLRARPLFECGSAPYQDVWALTKLRNGLVHFKPESSNELDEHKKLSKHLKGRAKHSAFWNASELLFPRAWVSHGSTVWAVNSTVAFMNKFAELAELESRTDLFKSKLIA